MINSNLNARIGRLLQELPSQKFGLRKRSAALKQAVNAKLSSDRARRLSVIILVVWFQRIKRSISAFTTA